MKRFWWWWPLEVMRLLCVGVWVGLSCMYGFARGFIALSRMPCPTVTIFASGRKKQDPALEQLVHQCARMLVKQGYSVITGGGPGLMKAANCGAASVVHKKGKTMTLGFGVRGLDEDFETECSRTIYVPYFFIRQWLLIYYSQAFILFPGGLGTADELFETLNLMKLKRIPRYPCILVGTDYWQPLVDWYHQAVPQGYIPQDSADLLVVVDDIHHALDIINKRLGSK